MNHIRINNVNLRVNLTSLYQLGYLMVDFVPLTMLTF